MELIFVLKLVAFCRRVELKRSLAQFIGVFFPPIMHSLKECVTPPFHWLIHYNVVLRLGLQILVNHACRYGHSSSYIQMSHFHLPYFEYHIMQTNIELVF